MDLIIQNYFSEAIQIILDWKNYMHQHSYKPQNNNFYNDAFPQNCIVHIIVSATTLYYTIYIVKCVLHSEITYHYSYPYLVRNSWVVCNQFLMLIINVHMHACMYAV